MTTDSSENKADMTTTDTTQQPRFKWVPSYVGKRFKKNGVTYEITEASWDWFDVDGEMQNLDSIRFTDGVKKFSMEMQEFFTKVNL